MRAILLGLLLVSAFPTLVPSLLSALVPSAAAATIGGLEVVPRGGNAQRRSTTVSTKGAAISTADFASVILDCAKYPMSASYMGVKALLDCTTLDHRPDGSVVIYQRTGGNFAVGSREYVLVMHTVEKTDTKVNIEWDLVKHGFDGTTYTGPYAKALQAHTDAVYTPYNIGGWVYDRTAGTITYWASSDPGGTVPDWLVSESAVTAFPLELLKVRWGVVP